MTIEYWLNPENMAEYDAKSYIDAIDIMIPIIPTLTWTNDYMHLGNHPANAWELKFPYADKISYLAYRVCSGLLNASPDHSYDYVADIIDVGIGDMDISGYADWYQDALRARKTYRIRPEAADEVIASLVDLRARLLPVATASESIKALAVSSGQRQVLRRYLADCNDPKVLDCSFDTVTEWAMPDGSVTVTRFHCF